MRTRNSGVRPGLRVAAIAFSAAAVLAAAGCGGGGDNSPPAFSRAAVVTNPANITYVGGNATVTVDVTDPAGVTPSSVKVDVKDATGTSIIGGPQVMTPSAV